MVIELLQPVLVIVIGYLVKKACEKLNIQLDEAVFNTIVGGIVVWLVGLVAQQATVAAFASFGIK